MSYASKGIFGAIAASLMLGAAQLASGHDLTGGLRAFSATELEGAQQGVNRAAKTDRAAPIPAPAAPTRTISLKLDRISDTSVLVRIPLAREARGSAAPAPLLLKSSEPHKPAFACEPVVSVLTEVAKRLPPGRCVT